LKLANPLDGTTTEGDDVPVVRIHRETRPYMCRS